MTLPSSNSMDTGSSWYASTFRVMVSIFNDAPVVAAPQRV
jgi:hypothetical protein